MERYRISAELLLEVISTYDSIYRKIGLPKTKELRKKYKHVELEGISDEYGNLLFVEVILIPIDDDVDEHKIKIPIS